MLLHRLDSFASFLTKSFRPCPSRQNRPARTQKACPRRPFQLEVLEDRLAPASLGLMAYYPFDGNGLDASGNGNDLTLVGNPTFESGVLGQAIVLDGTGNQYAQGPSAFNFGSSDFTIQVWVNYTESPSSREQTLIEQFSGAGGPGWTLTTPVYDNGFQFYASPFGGLINTTNTAPTGVWLDVVVERNGSLLSMFADNNLIATAPINGAIDNTSNPLLIGRRDSGDTNNYALDGELDDAAIWSRALTTNEIATLWNGGAGTPANQIDPGITNVVINQNITALYNAAGQPFAGAQRSMVNDIVYTFSEPVNIASPAVDPNVFTVAVASSWTGTAPTLSWASVAGTSDTEWAVTFSGNGVTGGSIADGAYTITVTDPGSIAAESDGTTLTLADSGVGGATQSFYRLFGDINGDGIVNAADAAKFKQALTTYNAAFDYNQDGIVNAFDSAQFKNDLTVSYSGFTPTI
jgi:hypothetical protein